MWLESVIVKVAERKLRPYRNSADVLKKKRATEYESYLTRIKELYANATYWHGTGRYHYSYEGESRYERVDAASFIDVLELIIERKGLTPHLDPWIASGGKTVSLGTVRMHSRLFARIHMYEKDALFYELGSAKYWVQLYMVLLILWSCMNIKGVYQFAKSFFRRSSYKDMQTWGSAIRKPKNGRVIRVFDVLSGNVVGSDIKNNYPVLIGIKRENTEVMDTVPLTHAVEVRSLHAITVEDFTHIEVPLQNMEETEALLRKENVYLPVLPMEFVDMYMSEFPLRTLAWF